MATKVFQLNDFAKELGVNTDKEVSIMKQSILLGVARSIPMLVEKSPVDTGLYAQSWGFEKSESGAILGNYAPHSPIIEFGARPFTPPLAPLLAWAKRVLGDSSQPPNYSSRVYALAVGTQKKIAAVGMQPKHILENSIDDILNHIKEEYINGNR